MTDSAFGLLVDDESQQASKETSERRLSAPQRSYDSAPHIAKDPKGFFTDPRNIMSMLTAAGIAAAPHSSSQSNLSVALQAGLGGLGTRGNIENTLDANRNDERTRLLDEQAQIDKAEQDKLQTQAAMDNRAFGYAQYMGNMYANTQQQKFAADQAASNAKIAQADRKNEKMKDFLKFVEIRQGEQLPGQPLPPMADLQAEFDGIAARNSQLAAGEIHLTRKPEGGLTYASRELVQDDVEAGAVVPEIEPTKRRRISSDDQVTEDFDPYKRPEGGIVGLGKDIAGAETTRRTTVTSAEVARLAPLAANLAKRYDASKGITSVDDKILQRIYRSSTSKEARERALHAAGFSVQDINGFNRSYGVGNGR